MLYHMLYRYFKAVTVSLSNKIYVDNQVVDYNCVGIINLPFHKWHFTDQTPLGAFCVYTLETDFFKHF